MIPPTVPDAITVNAANSIAPGINTSQIVHAAQNSNAAQNARSVTIEISKTSTSPVFLDNSNNSSQLNPHVKVFASPNTTKTVNPNTTQTVNPVDVTT